MYLFVFVCVIVCLVSFVGMRSRPCIGIGFPSRYAWHFICDCMCYCLSRFARCIAQSSLSWNGPSQSRCVALYLSLYVLVTCCPFRFARWLAHSSLDWNWPPWFTVILRSRPFSRSCSAFWEQKVVQYIRIPKACDANIFKLVY